MSTPPDRSCPCALAIGNFDGVHLGHRALLAKVVEYAARNGLVPAVLTFDPHPTAVVAPDRVPLQIGNLSERVRLLKAEGIERVTVLPFTAELARLSPAEFIRTIVIDLLGAKALFVGENFRFGYKKSGDCNTLYELGLEWHFFAHCMHPFTYRGEIVSSSTIRRYIEGGKISRANRLLGRCFVLSGPVVSGRGIGSKQTVPTLNIRPPAGQVLPLGVYVTETRELSGSRHWRSITNVGSRPTFGGEDHTIETYLLTPFEPPDPVEIAVEFRHFVRSERQFSSPDALKAQIFRDVAVAQRYWRRTERRSSSSASVY